MTDYEELLKSPKWKNKRDNIVERDKNTCTNCRNVLLFNNSILCRVHSNLVTSEWQVVRVGELLGRSRYKLFVPTQRFRPLERGYLVLVAPLQNVEKEFEKSATLIASKNETEKDILIQLLRSKIGVEDERFIQAVAVHRESIHNEWKHIKGLEVHHKYYQLGLMPWEYDDDALTTLCWYCHGELHKNGKVPVLDEYGNNLGEYTNCYRCHGAGTFPDFSHVQSGICFRCNGAKYEELRLKRISAE